MESDARTCARITRSHARTFALASAFLPPRKRRAAFALYSFCRGADDLVDEAVEHANSGAARKLAAYEQALAGALAGRPSGPVFRELHWTVREFGVPAGVLGELLAGIARDLEPVRYDTWPDLARYCEGVASTVGEMCAWVFGIEGGHAERERALRYARVLGVAMQLTNILRDVGEDARRGRCYLPVEDLAAFGIEPREVLSDDTLADDERWAPFVAFQIGRARALYETALPGIALLERDARRCALACADGYASILGALEALRYDSLRHRARPGTLARARVLWTAARAVAPADRRRVTESGPVVAWGPRVAVAHRVHSA